MIIQDRSIGELSVANKTGGEGYVTADTQLLAAMATQIAAMIDRMQLYQATDQDLRTRLQELDALSRVSHELSQTLDLSRILDVIRQEALRSTDATAVSVVLLTDRLERLPYLVDLSRVTLKTILVNVIFAMSMNVLSVVLGIGGWIGPVVGAVMHEVSALPVVANSARLIGWKRK